MPTLVVAGTEDILVAGKPESRTPYANIKHSELRIIENATTWSSVEAHQEFNAVLEEFLLVICLVNSLTANDFECRRYTRKRK